MTATAEVQRDGERNRPLVLIVEDHSLVAAALGLLLQERGHEPQVARLDGPDTVLEEARRFEAEVVLVAVNDQGRPIAVRPEPLDAEAGAKRP